tara:strand:+ start:2179 stop:2649 length:471 start_codon:yes stop_codon:yes gene_type:complete
MIRLRPAEQSDAASVFEWRNDPWIVSLSTSGQSVKREQHDAWFSRMLDREHHLFWIIESRCGEGMGIVKVDLAPDQTAVITAYLLKLFIGKGRGPEAIILATQKAFEQWPELKCINAFIRPENDRSIRAFSRVGFVEDSKGDARNEVKMSIYRPKN